MILRQAQEAVVAAQEAVVAAHQPLAAAAPAAADNNPALNISIFGAFVAVTLFIVIRASRNNKTAADYYAAGRSFTGPQNGFAIAGDYLSAASFLGIVGSIALRPHRPTACSRT